MKGLLTGAVLVVGVLALAYGGLLALGAWRWSQGTAALVARLQATSANRDVLRYDSAEVAGLPTPVRRYFELALTDGQAIVRTADLQIAGRFNMSLDAPQWKRFASVQHVTTHRPGFVWNARIAMFPGVPVRVTDSYVGGSGLLHPTVLGLFSVGTLQGEGEIAKAELMRWFAEAVWYPTALLPSQGVRWAAVDATSARATMTDGPLTLTMLFRFGGDGLIASVHAEGRSGTIKGVAVMMPWECRLSQYQTRDGMQVPMTGEALYLTPRGERSYFTGTVSQITFGFAGQGDPHRGTNAG
jgi:hypothetical protein